MILSDETAKQIINLKTSDRINKDIADRQFKVIVKAFNHLLQPENNYIYIADEVGLGKTYIAMGIATLLQHFSTNYEKFIGFILVPKKNLQNKWLSEFNRFVKNNYLLCDNRVKSVINMQISQINDEQIHERLECFNNNVTAYHIYRNSSFSMSSSAEMDIWKENLLRYLPNEHHSTFLEAWDFLNKEEEEIKKSEIRKLYAYLLNLSIPEIDILIVDEAHNFKYGIGEDTSYRNNVTSRFLGVVQDDKLIFDKFPWLRERVKPKAKKVIFLSATPINKSLIEIKNQLDCFIPRHEFSNINEDKLENEISAKLNTFLIRGSMNLQLSQNLSITRNQYRHEHRQGNVECSIEATPLRMQDGIQALVTGLVQYKTLKELNEKPNASFEIGMLAGFETFTYKHQNNQNGNEYEESSDSSSDEKVIKKLNDSYYDNFNSNLPHPKQDALVEELSKRMERCEKALVFVNRIASVSDIESKLLKKYESHQISKIKNIRKLNNPKVKHMIRLYEDSRLADDLKKTLLKVSERIYHYYKNELVNIIDKVKRRECILSLQNCLLELYEGDYQGSDIDLFRDEARSKINYKRFDIHYLRVCCDIIKKYIISIQNKDNDTDSDTEEERDLYFFTNYFSSSKDNRYPGKNFRKMIYDKDWFEINIAVIENNFNLGFKKSNKLSFQPVYDEKVNQKRDISKYDFLIETFVSNCYSSDSESSYVHENYLKRTFLTQLLTTELKHEFYKWFCRFDNHIKDNPSKLNDELEKLSEILKGVFRNGSGLLPSYLASTIDGDFESNFLSLLKLNYPDVLNEIRTILNDYDLLSDVNFSNPEKIQGILTHQAAVLGISGSHTRDVSKVAAQFRMPGFPYVLITTNILKEGEDLHTYCRDIYHYGIAWTPSDMEQRTGRIDRIGSLSYREILNKKSYDFDNKLHVYYPYLSDTLEVNQISRVFHDMNKFIKKFHDFTEIPETNKEINANEIVNSIPEQITSKLQSIYDIDNFNLVLADRTPLQLFDPIGKSREDVLKAFQAIKSILDEEFFGFIKLWQQDSFYIKGDIWQNNRRWPFSLKVINSVTPGDFDLEVGSIICRRIEIKGESNFNLIKDKIIQNGHRLEVLNDMMIVQGNINLFLNSDSIINKLIEVCELADSIEFEFTDKDDREVVFL